ncbi:RNA-directed DNA polymerase from mobile element jockey [Blattella germanica]|nr:RNA-directed DNA polymerase from mobile element jockey [Blattella germanica]
MYADDTVSFTASSDILIAADSLQNILNEISSWSSNWRIRLNSQKCIVKLFSMRKCTIFPLLSLNNENLNWLPDKEPVKYLGVYLDRRLNWNAHIKNKIIQANRRFYKLYPLHSPLRTEYYLLIYRLCIRPILTYASPVWNNASNTSIKKLQTFQNKILRIAVNAPWYIRNSTLHNDLGVSTIQDYITKLSHNFFYKLPTIPGPAHFNLGYDTNNPRIKNKFSIHTFLIRFANSP